MLKVRNGRNSEFYFSRLLTKVWFVDCCHDSGYDRDYCHQHDAYT